MMNGFERALTAAGYKVSGSSLASNIFSYSQKYDIGGSEESFGVQSNRTVISALKAFEQYVNTGSVNKGRKKKGEQPPFPLCTGFAPLHMI